VIAVPEWVPTPDNVQYNLAVEKLDRAIYQLINDRRKVLSKPGVEGGSGRFQDLLTQYLQVSEAPTVWMNSIRTL
jgi:hypothetical protein